MFRDVKDGRIKMTKTKRPYIGVGVIIRRDDKILLLKRKGSHGEGQWALPGGYLEFGETLRQCVAREVKEETGLNIEQKDLRFISLSEQLNYIKTNNIHCITVGFVIEYKGKKTPQIKEIDKSTVISWFTLNNLPSPLFTPSRDNINNFKNKKVF